MHNVSKSLILTFLFVIGTLSGSILDESYESFNIDSEPYESGPRNMNAPTLEYLSPASNSTYNTGDLINITIELNDTDGDDIAYAYVGVQSGVWSNNVWGTHGNISTASNSTIVTFSWNTWGYSPGTYYFHSNLTWTNGTNWSTWYSGVDYWNNYSINLVNSNNSAGGGNSGCGYDANFASIQATGIGNTNLSPNQSVTTFMTVNCAVYNSSISLVYWIYDSNNNTWDSGNHSWYHQSSHTTYTHNWNTTAPSTNGNYNFIVELFINGSIEGSDNDPFTVGSNNSGGNGNAGCSPEVVINSHNPTNPNGFANQSTFNSNEPITLYAYHYCFPTDSYHWNSTVYGPNGSYDYNYGNLNTTNNSWWTNVWEYYGGELPPGEYTWYYGFTNWGAISRYVSHNFTIVNNSSNNSGGNGNAGCSPEVVINSHNPTNPNGFANQSTFNSNEPITLYAYHYCFPADSYHWNSTVYGPNGFHYSDFGNLNTTNNSWWTNVLEYYGGELPSGEYTWYYGFTNWWDLSTYLWHNFTVIDSTASQSCAELETERLQQYYYAEETAVNTILLDCPVIGEDIEVYWKVTKYQDGTIMDDGWWNSTATSISMSHTVETTHLPIGTWYAFSATAYTDNGTLYEWHSFSIIPAYNPNPGPNATCGEDNSRTSIHVTNDANTNTYMGHEYYSDDDFNHEISLDCLINNSTYQVEYMLTHYHTGHFVDGGWWNFTANGTSASITKTWSDLPIQIWYAVSAVYTFENGVIISDYDKFYINSTTGPDLLGYCSFPTFEATPAAVHSGDEVTLSWIMDGDVSDQVYLSLFSGWGTQYYFSSIENNDGTHTITLPSNMNPDEDYTIYVESAYNDARTTMCWKYGTIDILEDDENPVLDDIINQYLNSTDERPRISMWYGKVNQHNDAGTWMTDPDGTAGAGLNSQWGDDGWGDRKLEYCQRFWPDTVEIRNSAPEEIVFYTRGNTDAYLSVKPVWLCIQDTDGDGILDPEDEDDDGDGWPDIVEDICFSDSLDPTIEPIDLNEDGICDVLQNLLNGAGGSSGDGFCTSGTINGGLSGQSEYVEVIVVEMTGTSLQYIYDIQDTTEFNELYVDIEQGDPVSGLTNADFTGYSEYYDIFVSDSSGNFDSAGSYITIQAKTNLNTQNLGVGHNIDSIGLRDSEGNVLHATEITAFTLGTGLGPLNMDGRQEAILGPADQIPTAMGNGDASITVGFCPPESNSDPDEGGFLPGFSAISGLAALGAAMLMGRRRVE